MVKQSVVPNVSREVLGLNLSQEPTILSEGFHGFPLPVQANVRKVTKIMPYAMFFPSYCYLYYSLLDSVAK